MQCAHREDRQGIQVPPRPGERQVVEGIPPRSDRQERTHRAQGPSEMQVAEETQAATTVIDLVALIAGEELVSTITRQDDLHVLAGQARDQKRRNRGRVRERLVESREHLVDLLEVARLDQELVMLGPASLRDLPGIRKLVVAVLAKPDRERLDRRFRHPCHDRDDRARIEATAQERADRNVADHVRAHRVL